MLMSGKGVGESSSMGRSERRTGVRARVRVSSKCSHAAIGPGARLDDVKLIYVQYILRDCSPPACISEFTMLIMNDLVDASAPRPTVRHPSSSGLETLITAQPGALRILVSGKR